MEELPLFRDDENERVYDLPVVPGAGDFTNPSFGVSISNTDSRKGMNRFDDYLGECDSMDEAIGRIFLYLKKHTHLSRYMHDDYKLHYMSRAYSDYHNEPGRVVFMDFGDPVCHGKIVVF